MVPSMFQNSNYWAKIGEFKKKMYLNKIFVPAIQEDVSTVFFILNDPESIKQCIIAY